MNTTIGFRCVAACFVALLACVAAAGSARLGTDAAVRLQNDDARLQFVLFDSANGRYWETLNEQAMRVGADFSSAYRFVKDSRKVLGTGRATLRKEGKGVRLTHDMTAHLEQGCAALGFVLDLRAAAFAGRGWKADGQDVLFPAEPKHTECASGSARVFALTFPDKSVWTLTFESPVRYLALDLRRRSLEEFELRLLTTEKPRLAAGKGFQAKCLITHSAGEVTPGIRDFTGVYEGEQWVKLPAFGEGIRPGSALDLSHAANRHAPAGTDGWLQTTTNGQFRFPRRASSVRFFGCGLRADQQLKDKKAGVDWAREMARRGYDSVRLRCADDRLLKVDAKGALKADPELCAQVDQLVASAKREGIYVMTDLLGARNWNWDELGLVAPGGERPSPRLASALFQGDERTFGAWKSAADQLFGRKNKVMGKSLALDPSAAFVVPASEAGLFSLWKDLRTLPDVRRGYAQWLAARRKKNPDFMAGSTCEPDDLAIMPLHEQKAAALRLFLAETERDGLERQRQYLRATKGLKARSLVGNASGSWHYHDVAGVRAEAGDFLCGSFHLDPPRNLGEKWTMPCRVDNVNPLLQALPVPGSLGTHLRKDKPYCMTSWSASGPSAWRAASGLMVGGCAARSGCDGLWRDDLPDDPLGMAADRAIWALFARGDLTETDPPEALVIRDGALTVRTDRTAGGFVPGATGRVVAPPLAAEVKGGPAAVWVSSLTDAPIASSKRLLLTHLTEQQAHGTLFADSRRDLMMRKGTGPLLMRAGQAAVELAVNKATAFRIYALAPDGTRLGRIASDVKDGLLVFTANVAGARGAQFLYELVRE